MVCTPSALSNPQAQILKTNKLSDPALGVPILGFIPDKTCNDTIVYSYKQVKGPSQSFIEF